MKKGILLNSEISATIASMGHTDTLVIADCGLPIPDTTKRIDISVTKGLPGFIDTLKAVVAELQVEETFIAKELLDNSSFLYEDLKSNLGDVKITLVAHEELKDMSKSAKACIRTGECIPYANIILKSGVTF